MQTATDPHIELPRPLRLSFLIGLRASEIIKKADWFIEGGAASWSRDAAAHEAGDPLTVGLYAETDPLVCLVPAAGAARPSDDPGIPRGLAHWHLRKRIAEAALPQAPLPIPVKWKHTI